MKTNATKKSYFDLFLSLPWFCYRRWNPDESILFRKNVLKFSTRILQIIRKKQKKTEILKRGSFNDGHHFDLTKSDAFIWLINDDFSLAMHEQRDGEDEKKYIKIELPCETNSWREMSHGRTPINANSTILRRTQSGSGRPLTNTPPNWFTPAWPVSGRNRGKKNDHIKNKISCIHFQSSLNWWI